MRNLVIIILSFITGFVTCTAQKTEFTLDYSVSYFLPSSQDTIQISIGENGKYIYTESEKITKKFKNSFSRFMPAGLESNPKMKLLFDMSTLDMLMYVDISDQIIAAKINLSNFFENNENDGTKALLSETTDEQATILGKKYPLVVIFPDSSPEEKLYAAFDNDYELNYNTYFQGLFQGILGGEISINIPSGILLYARDDKGKTLLQLVQIDKERKKGIMNLSFNIE